MKSLLTLLPSLMLAAAPLSATPEALPKQATVEELVELQNALGSRTALIHRRMPDVQGGPGFTQETAWLMLNSSPSVVSQEYDVLRLLPGVKHLNQALLVRNGRQYDRHTIIAFMPDGRHVTVEVWFDITDYFTAMQKGPQATEVTPAQSAPAPPRAEREVKAIIAKHLRKSEHELNGAARLIEDLGADALDIIEIVMEIDEQLGVAMSDEIIDTLKTVNDFVTYVSEHLD